MALGTERIVSSKSLVSEGSYAKVVLLRRLCYGKIVLLSGTTLSFALSSRSISSLFYALMGVAASAIES